ncbi:hypothetical protein [Gluconobacter oxydans]|uniref:hypothetical protein n=1 Tax=Gluconobacter oxydans TaxID=442 RepID=UPI00346423BA
MMSNWLNHIPQDLLSDSPSTEKLITLIATPNISTFLKDKIAFDFVPGIRERAFQDALILRTKAIYHFHASKSLNESGHSTFTAISMYDSCFFSAKSLIYLLGLTDIGRNSCAYVELFHKTEQPKRNKRSPKIYIRPPEIHKCYILEERMTHNMLWKIFSRMTSTLRGDHKNVVLLKKLSLKHYEQFSKERNKYSYDSAYWSRDNDIINSDLIHPQSYIRNIEYYSNNGRDYAEYIDKYYRTANLIINVIDDFLGELSKKSPNISEYFTISPPLKRLVNTSFL